MTDYTRSLNYVRSAIAELPHWLEQTLLSELPEKSSTPRTVVTTGIGASEGPARMLAALLVDGGVAARFCPLSDFAPNLASDSPPDSARRRGPAGELLVLFSQGLSPNARLVLAASANFARRWLVTSLDPRTAEPRARELLAPFMASDFTLVLAPPASESGTLVRLIGPTVAILMALRLAALLLDDNGLRECASDAPHAYRTAHTPVALDEAPIALVTVGSSIEAANAHRWKLLEALLLCDPPVWDVLQFAHGPLQAFYEKPLTILLLERGHGSPLVARLQKTLSPARHQVLHLTSERSDALSYFEHAAAIDALLAVTLERAPRDLFDWPARNADGPLYGLGQNKP
jgi:hypothetical protein